MTERLIESLAIAFWIATVALGAILLGMWIGYNIIEWWKRK